MSNNDDISIVHALRGFAALFVASMHLLYSNPAFPGDNFAWLITAASFGGNGVEMFFVISGFIIPFALHRGNYKLTEDFLVFFKKRLIRLEPAYILSIFIVMTAWYLSSLTPWFAGKDPDFDVIQVLNQFIYLNNFLDQPFINEVGWTLAIEFQFYLFLSLLYPIFVLKGQKLFCLIALGFATIPFFWHGTEHFLPRWAVYFVLGICTFRYFVGKLQLSLYCALVLCLAVMAYFTSALPAAIAGVLTAILIASNITIKARPVLFLGTISYSLYLLHTVIGMKVVNLLARFELGLFAQLASMVFVFALVIYCSYLFYRFVELPTKKWSKHFTYKNSTFARSSAAA